MNMNRLNKKAILLNAPSSVLRFMEADLTESIEHMVQNFDLNCVNTHFWISIIDSMTSKMIYPSYFASLCSNESNMLELEAERRSILENNQQELSNENSQINLRGNNFISDNYVSFCIASFDEKVKIWNKANLDLKFEYWKAMQLNYDILEKEDSKHSNSESSIVIRNLQNSESNSIDVRENSSEYMMQEAYEIISDCNTSQRNFVTKCQLQLWKSHTSSEIRLGLWINKFKDSNSYLRITLWNSLGLPAYYFNKVAEQSSNKILETSQTAILIGIFTNSLVHSLSNEELNLLAEFILENNSQSFEEIDKLKHEQVQNAIYNRINAQCLRLDDYRTQLWLPLPVEHKLMMIISENDQKEAALMSLLVFRQYDQQVKIIKKLDQKLEDTLKNIFYDRYMSLCNQKSTEMSVKRFQGYSDRLKDEEKAVSALALLLHSKFDQMDFKICKMRKELINRQYH